MQSALNEWQENLSLIVLSKLVLYIHISSFRVRFYEKKSKMTCVRVFFFVIFFECSQIARAGVQGLSHDAMLCDYGLFNHTSALNVLQGITSWQIEPRRRRMWRRCRQLLARQLLPRKTPRSEVCGRRYLHFNQWSTPLPHRVIIMTVPMHTKKELNNPLNHIYYCQRIYQGVREENP